MNCITWEVCILAVYNVPVFSFQQDQHKYNKKYGNFSLL